jgi:hypothetical protein
MSVNLQCKQFQLRQVPTLMSELVYSRNDGGWRGVCHRYELWTQIELGLKLNSLYYREASAEDRQWQIDEQQTHVKRLREQASKPAGLDFYLA